MNVSRFCSVQGAADDAASHQRVSEFVKPKMDLYPAKGFTIEHEFVAEKTVEALKDMLAAQEKKYSAKSYGVILSFLMEASTEKPGNL